MQGLRAGECTVTIVIMYSLGDRTAKAIIRDAAIELFGRDGFDTVSLRTIAGHSGVSQPLIIKHYGSRSGLINATDEHALSVVERLLHTVAIESGGAFNSEATTGSVAQLLAGSTIGPYLARLLTSNGDRARRAFKRLAEFSCGLIDQLADDEAIASDIDHRHLAVVLLVHDISVLVLRDRITEALGADPLDREGVAAWSRTVQALYSGEALTSPNPRPEGTPQAPGCDDLPLLQQR